MLIEFTLILFAETISKTARYVHPVLLPTPRIPC